MTQQRELARLNSSTARSTEMTSPQCCMEGDTGWDGVRHRLVCEPRHQAQGRVGSSILGKSMTLSVTGPLQVSLTICRLNSIQAQGNQLGTAKPYEKRTFSSLKG